MTNLEKLKPNQARALIALLTESNVKKAAVVAGVSAKTLHRWTTTDQAFRNALQEAEGQAVSSVARGLVRLADLSLAVIEETLRDKKAQPGAKLRAADLVLTNLLRLRELHNVETRLAALERALTNEKPT